MDEVVNPQFIEFPIRKRRKGKTPQKTEEENEVEKYEELERKTKIWLDNAEILDRCRVLRCTEGINKFNCSEAQRRLFKKEKRIKKRK